MHHHPFRIEPSDCGLCGESAFYAGSSRDFSLRSVSVWDEVEESAEFARQSLRGKIPFPGNYSAHQRLFQFARSNYADQIAVDTSADFVEVG
jgi:hypothetical protein